MEEPVSALYDTYKNSLLVADSLGATSIAFPAISIGIFECDKHDAAAYAIQAIIDTAPQTKITDVYLTILDKEYHTECVATLDAEHQKI